MNAITRIPAMPAITTFVFDGHPIRVAHVDDQPRFVATDVCKALKLTNPSVSLRVLDEDERSKIFLGPQGEALAVTEGGLYTLIMRCQRALVKGSTAWRFRKWATSEVLPAVRRTGSYVAQAQPVAAPVAINLDDNRTLRRLLLERMEREDALAEQLAITDQELLDTSRALTCAQHTIEEQSVTVEAFDRLTSIAGGKCITDTAKRLGVGPRALFAYMRAPEARVRWLIKRSAQSEDAVHQDRLNAKDMLSPVETIKVGPEGEQRDKDVTRILVTPKGLGYLARLIVEGRDPLLPVPVDMLEVVRLSRIDRGLFD
ncbi:Phage antirepressor protein KilAC domain-containing protein [Methylobacterium sp. 174MFSha1.1]|uniref:BRO family protein n=1 Tax=Methylobacterium sp. 174MFSha1.1 TaxID=1502749 RepID=UPI0008F2122D|nr:BRO family protein [Methylobacterium sp. 174MFSha1.1]SFU93441.1 Phage antirepressor protein KilAC domain-containing protein [Methylobacterium sp. 174MFSha1.1]